MTDTNITLPISRSTVSFLKKNENISNFTGGFFSGFLTGILVGPVEALKVELQNRGKTSKAIPSLSFQQLSKNLIKATPPLTLGLAATCAFEFSVNDAIKNKYGIFAGIISSAFTGAVFLTASDHLMLRKINGERYFTTLSRFAKTCPSHLLTGFTPMFFRESFFISSVMYLGPSLGKLLKSNFADSQEKEKIWTAVGRMLTGLVTTFISHPFDSLTREMQKSLSNFNEKPKIANIIRTTPYAQLFKGVVPRLALASCGGTIIGGIYEAYKESLDRSEIQNRSVYGLKR